MGVDYESNNKKRKNVAVIGVSSLILVAMVVATVGYSVRSQNSSNSSGNAAGGTQEISASQKAVKSLCQPTDFRQTCEESLAGSNTTDVKELIKIAFDVAEKRIGEAANRSVTLQELEKDTRNKEALQACKEMADFAVADLRRSFDTLSGVDLSSDLKPVAEDLKVWLSAAVTYQETCLDGFQNTTGTAGENMRKALNTSAQLTRNGLAMVDQVTTLISSLQIPGLTSRRLLWEDERRNLLNAASPEKLKPDMVVAKDGSGDYKTIKDAVMQIPQKSNKTFVLYIKAGVYEEVVHFNKSLTNLIVYGDGPTKTRITGNLNFIDGTPTFKTATVAVLGENFLARDIGFENSAGAEKHQAVALRIQADRAIFYNVHIDGYQDSLYVHAYRQFFRDCTVTGTIDFVFGDAAAVFQNCTFVIRKPLENQACIVTAQGRKDHRQPTALVLQSCHIVADPAFIAAKADHKAYLGRPWKEYSRTIILDSYIDANIDATGWMPWMGTFGIDTCFYTEFNNVGPGSEKTQRVKWKGVKTISDKDAAGFTPGTFLSGDSWVVPSGVPYVSGRAAVASSTSRA